MLASLTAGGWGMLPMLGRYCVAWMEGSVLGFTTEGLCEDLLSDKTSQKESGKAQSRLLRTVPSQGGRMRHCPEATGVFSLHVSGVLGHGWSGLS